MKEISNCKILELAVQNAKIISKSGSVSLPDMEVELDSPKNLIWKMILFLNNQK